MTVKYKGYDSFIFAADAYSNVIFSSSQRKYPKVKFIKVHAVMM